MSNIKCDKNHSTCNCKPSSASQTLEELDFERGIWNAAQYGDLEKLVKLVETGKYEVNQRDSAGYTALHYAARNGRLGVCQYLVEKGGDVNAVTRSGRASALNRACSAGEENIVKFLLSKKANPNLKDSDGKTALHRAAENNHPVICEVLLKYRPDLKDIPDNKGMKPVV